MTTPLLNLAGIAGCELDIALAGYTNSVLISTFWRFEPCPQSDLERAVATWWRRWWWWEKDEQWHTSESGPLSTPGHWNVTNSWHRLWTTNMQTTDIHHTAQYSAVVHQHIFMCQFAAFRSS